jgi:hypothetical protein
MYGRKGFELLLSSGIFFEIYVFVSLLLFWEFNQWDKNLSFEMSYKFRGCNLLEN